MRKCQTEYKRKVVHSLLGERLSDSFGVTGSRPVASAPELSTQGAEGVFVVAFVDGGGDGHLRTLSGTDRGARRSGVHDHNVDTLFFGVK